MTDSTPAEHQAAANYLRELLLRPGTYRSLWEQHVVRARRDEVNQLTINQLAVAEVLARYVSSHPRKPGDEETRPLKLKDTVSRMLSGRMLSRTTLALFIAAFGLTDGEADRLWRLWHGSAAICVLSGSQAVSAATQQDVRAVLGPPRHRTVSMHDHVQIGRDRLLARTRTILVIEAAQEGLDRYPYLYDTSSLTLEVGQGCKEVSGELYQIGDGIFATHIMLAKVLALGETITLEYWTSYLGEPGGPESDDDRRYRRAVIGALENLDMRVEFHPDALPATVWWANWDGIDGDVLEQEEVTLDSQHSAQRYLRYVSKTVAGFHWSWK